MFKLSSKHDSSDNLQKGSLRPRSCGTQVLSKQVRACWTQLVAEMDARKHENEAHSDHHINIQLEACHTTTLSEGYKLQGLTAPSDKHDVMAESAKAHNVHNGNHGTDVSAPPQAHVKPSP
jgi:hypothetical protein